MVDPRSEVVWSAVAVVDVIGMLPHVDAEDRLAAMDERVLAVRRLGDLDLAVLEAEPAPAGAELRNAGLDEVFLGLVDRPERVLQRLLELARHLGSSPSWLHPFPEVDVVVVLTGVIEYGGVLAERPFDDLFEGLALPLGSLERVIPVVDVGQVMLVVVIFQGFSRHMRLQRVISVRKVRQRETHRSAPWRLSDGSLVRSRRTKRPAEARKL